MFAGPASLSFYSFLTWKITKGFIFILAVVNDFLKIDLSILKKISWKFPGYCRLPPGMTGPPNSFTLQGPILHFKINLSL